MSKFKLNFFNQGGIFIFVFVFVLFNFNLNVLATEEQDTTESTIVSEEKTTNEEVISSENLSENTTEDSVIEDENNNLETGNEDDQENVRTDDAIYRPESDLRKDVSKLKIDETSGALIYNYNVETPIGRNGLEPNLELSYNSQNQDNNSIFGYGWSINIPYIERVNKDGIEKLYTENDFYFSLSGELKQIGETNFYGPRVERGDLFTYEFVDNQYWLIKDKKGNVYKFGLDANSRQDNIDGLKIYRWMLQEIRDTNNNFIRYEYYKDAGQIYPSKIYYTGNGNTDGIFEVEFLRENRNDDLTVYNFGFPIKTNYRINEIQAKINEQWVKKYNLIYGTGDNGVRSILSSITKSSQNEDQSQIEVLPADEFEYNSNETRAWNIDASVDFPVSFIQYSYSQYRDTGARFAEINGDGLIDIVKRGNSDGGVNGIYLNNGDNTWSLEMNYTFIPYDITMQGNDRGVRIVDINGDGLDDFLLGKYNNRAVYINNGGGSVNTIWEPSNTFSLPYSFQLNSSGLDNGVRLADVNGDGLIDILYAFSSSQTEYPRRVYINNGENWILDENYTIPVSFFDTIEYHGWADTGARLIDVNGDSLVDIVLNNETVYINKGDGTGWEEDDNYDIPIDFITYAGGDYGVRFEDINGDNLTDLISASTIYNRPRGVYINKGDGTGWAFDDSYSLPIGFSFANDAFSDWATRLTDLNGDSLPDFVRANGNDKGVAFSGLKKSDSLYKINDRRYSDYEFKYKSSSSFIDNNNLLNPNLPLNIQTVNQIIADDGLGNISTTTYSYSGGDFYYNNPHDKKFAGFAQIKTIDDLGNQTINYYHQGNESDTNAGEYLDNYSKIGNIYRTEIYDTNNNLYQVQLNKFESNNLGDDRNFVKMTQSLQMDFDGNSTHRDSAQTYSYNNTNGNLLQSNNWGEVSANSNGTFTDVGNDKSVAQYEYAHNPNTGIYLISQEVVFDQNSTKQKENKYYYDNLSYGEITNGNLTKQDSWMNDDNYVDTEKSYNNYGLVIGTKDPRDKITSYTYDEYNLYPISISNSLNQSESYTYDYSSSQIKSKLDANGNLFEIVYDPFGRVVEEKQPDSDNPINLVIKKSYIYDDVSFPRSVHEINYLDDSNSFDVYIYLDGLDRKIQIKKEAEDGKYSTKDFIYNSLGLLAEESLPYFSLNSDYSLPNSNNNLYIEYTYDTLYRPIEVSNSVGTSINNYDNWNIETIDANSNMKKFYHDAYNNLIKVDEHNNNNIYETNYFYDLSNNLIQIQDALGNVRKFEYDGLGRLLNSEDLHHPSDNIFGIYNYIYDASSNLISKIEPNGDIINYTYDDLNRVLTEDFTGNRNGIDWSYVYDICENGVGKLCVATSSDYITNYHYDVLGNIKTESKNINNKVYNTNYSFDRQSNQKSITYPDNSIVRYNYNSSGLLEYVQQKENNETTYASIISGINYSPAEKIVTEKFANGVISSYSYDANHLYRLISKLTTDLSDSHLQDLSYFYDNVGNIIKINDSSSTHSSKNTDYIYDNLYRLISVVVSHTANNMDYSEQYQYDALGNILQFAGNNYLYEGNDGDSYANPHAVTNIDGVYYNYDRNGNLLTDGNWNFIWDYNNRLISSESASSTSSYKYDNNGNRIKLVENNKTTIYPNKYYNEIGSKKVNYIFANDRLVATIEKSDNVLGEPVPNGVVSQRKTMNKYYNHSDHLNSSSIVTNSKAQVEQLIDYYPFGDIRLNEKSNSFDEQRKFTGHEHDNSTDLEYMLARYYNANIGRFISQDPVFNAIGNEILIQSKTGLKLQKVLQNPQALNSYSYAINNPIIIYDPNGEWLKELITGKQSLSDFKVEVGQAAQYLYDNNDLAKTVMDHPVGTGVVVGVAGGAVFAGASIGVTYGLTEMGLIGSQADKADDIVSQGAKYIDPNKLNHIFSQSKHELDSLVRSFGTQEKAYNAIQQATEVVAKQQNLTGVFRDISITVDKQIVNVSGKVVDGAVKIGTAYVKK